MNIYMQQILKDVGTTCTGNKLNHLVKSKVLTCNYIVTKAIESKDPYIMYNVAEYLENISYEDIERLAEAIIKEKYFDIICDYAIYIKGAPIDKIVDEIIKNGKVQHIVKLASELTDPPIEKLEKAIIKIGDPEQIYNYSINVINKDSGYNYNMVARLADAIIQTRNVKYVYEFAKNIFGAPMEKLAKAIIESKNEEYIKKFKELPNVPGCFDDLVERAKLEKTTEEEKMRKLLNLIYYNEIDKIEFNADIYRRLFVDTDEEIKEIEEEIKHKKRTLTKEPGQGMHAKPQFSGERKLKK